MSIDLASRIKELMELFKQSRDPKQYELLLTTMCTGIPPVHEWEKTPWLDVYGRVTDAIYERTLKQQAIDPREQVITAFERVSRPKGKTLEKDLWFLAFSKEPLTPREVIDYLNNDKR